MGTPIAGWLMRENPTNMEDLGVPLFQYTSILGLFSFESWESNKNWLVVWNINFIFPLILGCSHHPNWLHHIFQRGGYTTTNQKKISMKFGDENHVLWFRAPRILRRQATAGSTKRVQPSGRRTSLGSSQGGCWKRDGTKKGPLLRCWWMSNYVCIKLYCIIISYIILYYIL